MSEAPDVSAATPRPVIPPEIVAAPVLSATVADQGELVPVAGRSDLKAKMEFASNHANYINTYIALADTKATWAFAIPAAAIAYVSAQQEIWTLIVSPAGGWIKALAGITLMLLLISTAASFAVIVPRLAGASDGIVYFGAVAGRKSAGAYLDDLSPLSEAALADARIRHNFELARVCARKYGALRAAMWSGLLALVALLVLIAMLKLSQLATGEAHLGGTRCPAQRAEVAPR